MPYTKIIFKNFEYALPVCSQAQQQRQPQTGDRLQLQKRLLRARHRQCLTVAHTRETSRRPRTNSPSGQLQTTVEQDPRSFTNSTSESSSQQALNSAEATTLVSFLSLMLT